jgi:imidazolonepropionase
MGEGRIADMKKGPSKSVDLILHSANQLLTLAGGPQRGNKLGALGIIEGGAIVVNDGHIIDIGLSQDIRNTYTAKKTIDASGKIILPGFVDPHTHLAWVGDRSTEFEMRISGASYMEIMAAGGGIASTVNKTREASIPAIKEQTRPRIACMLAHGTTTAEAKSGYGLNFETEAKLLTAIMELDQESPLQIVPTFLGAHALPPDYERTDEAGYESYTQDLINDMLPKIQEWWLTTYTERDLPFVDVFCEKGAFTLEQSERILNAARSRGFPLKIHADEFIGLGGTKMAVQLGAVSADHLVQTPPEDIAALGSSSTVAVALPSTPFGLGEREYTPAVAILEQGGILALASDLNPGTAWCESMQMVIALACRYMKLTPAQAIASATINAAAAIRLDHTLGSLEAGKQADILVLDVPNYRHLGYRFGTNLVELTVKRGEIVYTSPSHVEV